VGASVTGVSTYTSNTSRASASQADSCAAVRDAKTSEVTLPIPEAEPIAAHNVAGRRPSQSQRRSALFFHIQLLNDLTGLTTVASKESDSA